MHIFGIKPLLAFFGLTFCLFWEFSPKQESNKEYQEQYFRHLGELEQVYIKLSTLRLDHTKSRIAQSNSIINEIHKSRLSLKAADLWLRYLEPVQYRLLNGALPVEWEAEVYEKWLPPNRRISAGFTIAENYLEDNDWSLDSLHSLFKFSVVALQAYKTDSITKFLSRPDHFYFANRLFLLNLGTIYTTGFECMNSERILPELHEMLEQTALIYSSFNSSFPAYSIEGEYINLFNKSIDFISSSKFGYLNFDHFLWIRDFVNPLFKLNQQMIRTYKLQSSSYMDYALNNKVDKINDKRLYIAQNHKPLFLRVYADSVLNELRAVGKQLFYDPILSSNLERSCASCHNASHFFTDTVNATAIKFNREGRLDRNAPTLVNASLNHLIMHDGQHRNLLEQLIAVHKNPEELNGDPKLSFKHILSCKEYKDKLTSLASRSAQKKLSFDHVMAAIIFYYTSFDYGESKFDNAVVGLVELSMNERRGFNIFMGKAQCGTCHFMPHFNGMKPPYTSNEFEVLGTPTDSSFKALSKDLGRFGNHPVPEMKHAFRTNTLRNISKTKPYMHNGVFSSLDQVINFYDLGGGQGRGLSIENQTLSSDSLHLSDLEKLQLLDFMKALDENIVLDTPPNNLPVSRNKKLNKRVVGGIY